MLDMVEFGKRVQEVRENILKMNQSELAKEINTSQALLSRVERGIGGNINIVFDLINFLNARDINAKEMFSDLFSIDLVKGDSSAIKSQLEELIKDLQKTLNNTFDKLSLLLSLEK